MLYIHLLVLLAVAMWKLQLRAIGKLWHYVQISQRQPVTFSILCRYIETHFLNVLSRNFCKSKKWNIQMVTPLHELTVLSVSCYNYSRLLTCASWLLKWEVCYLADFIQLNIQFYFESHGLCQILVLVTTYEGFKKACAERSTGQDLIKKKNYVV